MDAEAAAPLLHHASAWDLRGTFAASIAVLVALLLGITAAFAEFSEEATPAHVDRYYSFLTDVLVMGEWCHDLPWIRGVTQLNCIGRNVGARTHAAALTSATLRVGQDR